ncbi:MAG: bifunctional methylenetetrahydrofolate dehydrogenase/methenyltetrahydrofolate cyclohydrolase FolD [Candidatus Sericytochromatia bacterium]
MALLDGKALAAELEASLKSEVERLSIRPGLAVILAGDDSASKIYVGRKEQACQRVGFFSEMVYLPADISQEALLAQVQTLNHRPDIHGILVQLPLPPQIDVTQVLEAVAPEKDVDGFHPINAGHLFNGTPSLVPCTALGVMHLLKRHDIPIAGQRALVIGRSNIVGKPMAMLLLQEHATVTIAHSRTPNLGELCFQADIIVAAVGKAKLVTADMVKAGAVVIDVGMNRSEGKLCGDVDFETVAPKASWITPVPGGVGPMTISCLLLNTLQAARHNLASSESRG